MEGKRFTREHSIFVLKTGTTEIQRREPKINTRHKEAWAQKTKAENVPCPSGDGTVREGISAEGGFEAKKAGKREGPL